MIDERTDDPTFRRAGSSDKMYEPPVEEWLYSAGTHKDTASKPRSATALRFPTGGAISRCERHVNAPNVEPQFFA